MFKKTKLTSINKALTQECVRTLKKIVAENKKALGICKKSEKVSRDLDDLNQKMLRNNKKTQEAFNNKYC